MQQPALEAFGNEQEFLDSLQGVLERDYDAVLMGEQLREAGRNLNEFLKAAESNM